MLGVDFSIDIAPRFVDSSSFTFLVASNGLFDPLSSVVVFMQNPQGGRLDVAMGKIDRVPVSGHGLLGEVRFIVEEDLNGFRSLEELIRTRIDIKRIRITDTEGEVLSLPDTVAILAIEPTRPVDNRTTLHIFPNPAQERLWFGEAVQQYEILNVQGQIVQRHAGGDRLRYDADISQLPVGLYLLQYTTGDGVRGAAKFQVLR